MSRLSDSMTVWVLERTEAALTRFLPDLVWPRHFAGCNPAPQDVASLSCLVALLHRLGVRTVMGRSTSDVIATTLAQLDGPATTTFYSFFSAESVLALGGFDDTNPVVQQWNPQQRHNAIQAFDTTSIYDPKIDALTGLPNNYWAVLARAELARDRLGLLKDRSVLDRAMNAVRDLLLRNPLGFFDDSRDFAGRFDIYSPDFLLFLEPLWPVLDPAVLARMKRVHTRLFESLCLENGAMIGWGRSVGALSLCLTMELGAMSIKERLASDPSTTLALVHNAFGRFADWFEDDLISAHRYRMTFGYRGIHRLLQMTFDCLSKVAYAAHHLKEANIERDEKPLFTAKDEWIPFEQTRASGVWMIRHGIWACQFPSVAGVEADYVPWFHQPGVFENPVDSGMLCGVPRVMIDNVDHAWPGPAQSIEKRSLGLTATFDTLRGIGSHFSSKHTAHRRVDYQFDASSLTISEELTFETLPEAISVEFAESDKPLGLIVESDTPFVQNTVAVSGMPGWRSFWGEIRRVHQVRFTPARRVQFRCRLTPS